MEGEEPAHINEDRHQEEDIRLMIREADDEQETDNILDYAIEYRMTGLAKLLWRVVLHLLREHNPNCTGH